MSAFDCATSATLARGSGESEPMDLYPLTEKFAEAAAYYAATSPAWVARIGHQVDPSRMPDGPARHIFEIVRQVWLAEHRGPTSAITVVQRLRSRVDDGRLTRDELFAANGMLDDVQDDPRRPTEQDVTSTLTPILKKDYAEQIADAAADEFGQGGGDFTKTIQLIDRSKRVGVVDESLGSTLDDASADELEELSKLEKLPTGVAELDHVLRGGPRCGCFAMWLGGTGDGKSIGLTHVSGSAMRLHKNVAYATLEVGSPDTTARLLANLLGWTIDECLEHPRMAMRAARDLDIGRFHVKEFTAQVTKVPDIAAWVDALEQKKGYPIDMLAIDYGDLVGAHTVVGAAKKRDDSSYTTGSVVFQAMRDWANDKKRKRWLWTASAAQRRKDKKAMLDTDNAADSLHKSRIAELIATLNVDDDRQITIKVAKHRFGGAGQKVGPLPSDYEHGRLVSVNEDAVPMPPPPTLQVIKGGRS